MREKQDFRKIISSFTARAALLAATLLIIGTTAFGQDTMSKPTPTATPAPTPMATPKPTPMPTPTPLTPFVTELKGISLGMTSDEVKDKLGKPDSGDETGMYYLFSENESAQIGLDARGKVRTVALSYSNGDADVPKFEDIFGPDVKVVTKKDGGIYKLIRYRAAGYWVAYSRIMSNKKPLTTITMRKLRK